MWQMRYHVLRLPCLLAAVALVFPSVTSRPNDGPIQAALRLQSERPTPESHWEWNSAPNPNATDHLIFNSVSSLLQRWPNGLRRNGASYVTLDIGYFTKKPTFVLQVTVLSPQQSPKGRCYTMGVQIPESQFHLAGLRSTLTTLTCSAVNLAMSSLCKQSATSVLYTLTA